ncbi:hypothetical protein Tsubulata_007967 [Turnera subulata]|uniref:Uncharacterized protein n=1 Tax=Turnera subulata TaxID=218843 RepID=A0A9Q0G774_9ROSI|nr:hypothetical protein Tsubulata_007967 [Turnera subulata]
MESECNASKPRYDITMSKRTRKPRPPSFPDANGSSPTDGYACKDEEPAPGGGVVDPWEEQDNDHKSLKLKQLINGPFDKSSSKDENDQQGSCRGRNSLGQHFTEEEEQIEGEEQQPQQQQQLQLVMQHKQDGRSRGLKLKGMMGHYVSVLSHLITVKRHPRIGSRNKPFLRLAM